MPLTYSHLFEDGTRMTLLVDLSDPDKVSIATDDKVAPHNGPEFVRWTNEVVTEEILDRCSIKQKMFLIHKAAEILSGK